MARTQIVAIYAVPIPVGHKVTVRWYRRESTGLLGGKKSTEREFEPSILDHDTGIEWVSDFAHDGGEGVKRPDQPVRIATTPMQEFVVERELTGRVTACRVVHIRRFTELDVQTHLELER